MGPGEAPPGTKGFCPKLSQTKLLIWGQSGTEGRVFVWLKSALGLSTKRCRDKRYTKAIMVDPYGDDNMMGTMTSTQCNDYIPRLGSYTWRKRIHRELAEVEGGHVPKTEMGGEVKRVNWKMDDKVTM